MKIKEISNPKMALKELQFCESNLRLSAQKEDTSTSSPRAAYRKFKAEQCSAVKLNIVENPVISATFTNTTDTEAHITISEVLAQHPFVYSYLVEMTLAPGQKATVQLKLDAKKDLQRVLSIQTEGGQGYGHGGSDIAIDLTKPGDMVVDLFPQTIYPGEDFWPPVPPFEVIKAKIHT